MGCGDDWLEGGAGRVAVAFDVDLFEVERVMLGASGRPMLLAIDPATDETDVASRWIFLGTLGGSVGWHFTARQCDAGR